MVTTRVISAPGEDVDKLFMQSSTTVMYNFIQIVGERSFYKNLLQNLLPELRFGLQSQSTLCLQPSSGRGEEQKVGVIHVFLKFSW